jgi:epoxyqueuosine reductase QueG
METMTSKEIKALAFELGADLCGIASADRFGGAPAGYSPLDLMPSCKSAIVIGRSFPAGFLQCNDPMVPYTVIRNVLSNMLDVLSINLIAKLEQKGIVAITTGAIDPTNFDTATGRMRQVVSAKHCAQAAGLGVIGKNTLLINEEYGNMLWLVVVLTELELEPDAPVKRNYCGNCSKCIDICPAGATGALSEDGQPTLRQFECKDYAFGSVDGGDWRVKCFRCRVVCPYALGSRNRGIQRDPMQIYAGGYMEHPPLPDKDA